MSKSSESKAPASLKPAIKFLREQALGYPETREDHPWGHSAFKVKEKVFLFMGADEDGLGLSVKLPESKQEALAMPFCEPTEYGLGKHGWVSATFPPDQLPPLELLMGWIDESYRAIAPRKLAAKQAGGITKTEPPRRTAPPARPRNDKKSSRSTARAR